MCLALPQVSRKLFMLRSAVTGHTWQVQEVLRLLPHPCCTQWFAGFFFQAFSDSVSPYRLGIDSCQTAYKKMFVRFDIKRTSPTPCFLNSVLSPSLDLGTKFKALFLKHWLLRLQNKTCYYTLTDT